MSIQSGYENAERSKLKTLEDYAVDVTSSYKDFKGEGSYLVDVASMEDFSPEFEKLYVGPSPSGPEIAKQLKELAANRLYIEVQFRLLDGHGHGDDLQKHINRYFFEACTWIPTDGSNDRDRFEIQFNTDYYKYAALATALSQNPQDSYTA